MSLFFIIGIIVIGLILIAIEIFLLPGTTIAAIVGGLVTIGGVVLGYMSLGVTIGNILLISASIASALIFYIGYKTMDKKGMVLNHDLEMSRANELPDNAELQIGKEGIALGDIKPTGKVIINNNTYAARSFGNFIPDNSIVKVIEIKNGELLVKRK